MPTPEARLARGDEQIAKYNRRLLWLAGVTAAVLVALLSWTLIEVARSADEAKAQTLVIRELLEQQESNSALNEAGRAAAVQDIIDAVATEQYRALVAHDRRTEEALSRALGLLDREVNAPANQEQPRTAPAPFVGPRVIPIPQPTAPRTAAPAPTPAPSPCEKAGRSGKCKK